MDGSMNNILTNNDYEENQFNAQLVDNLNIEDFQEFINKSSSNQKDSAMAIENENYGMPSNFDTDDVKDRIQNCQRKCNQYGVKTFGDLFDNSLSNVAYTLERYRIFFYNNPVIWRVYFLL